MRQTLKYLALPTALFLAVSFSGSLVRSYFNPGYSDHGLIILSFSFLLSSGVSLVIFSKGLRKEKREQGIYTFVSITVKFLLELFIALFWFVLAKNSSPSSVILFFVLYLSFSMISIGTMLKALKNNPLKRIS